MTSFSIAAALGLACGVFVGSDALAQNVQKELVVLKAPLPKYPALPMSARVSGTVAVDIHVENSVVTKAVPRSGPALLIFETVRNIKTWRFEPQDTGDVTTAFDYRLRDAGSDNPEIDLRLPYRVTITARPPRVTMVP